MTRPSNIDLLLSHGLKSMNGIVRNTLFRNPATQLAGVLFTSTHKEPGKRQFDKPQ